MKQKEENKQLSEREKQREPKRHTRQSVISIALAYYERESATIN